jgi:hypothetical protein
MKRFNQSVFLVLLAALVLLLVVQPQIVDLPKGQFIVSCLTSLLQVVAIYVLAEDRRLRVFAWVFGLPTIIAIWSRHYIVEESQETAILVAHGLACVLLICTAVLILHYVLTHEITTDSVIGAICAYLLIGVALGQLCFVVETVQPGAYHTSDLLAKEFDDPDARSALLMYFSFTTLTTTGYGDIVPNRPISRTLAWMESAAGQLYLAVLVAGLVSMHANKRSWSGSGAGGSRKHDD